MNATAFFFYFGVPTLFLLFCMSLVRWLVCKRRDPQRDLLRWVAAWGLAGFLIAILLAIIASIMNNDFVYSHASLLWPFCLSLGVLDNKPSLGVTALVIGMMGVENGFYYAVLATAAWLAVRLVRGEAEDSRLT